MTDQPQFIEHFVRRVLGAELDDLVVQMRDYAVPPMFLTADAASGHLKRAYEEAVSKVNAELERESTAVVARLQVELPWHLEEEALARALIECATSGAYFTIPVAALLPGRPDARVFREHRKLRDRLDQAGLVDLTGLESNPQVIFCDERAVQYHPLLRRFFTGHVNATLLGTLLALQTTGRACLKVAVDDDHSMPRADFSQYVEADHWQLSP